MTFDAWWDKHGEGHNNGESYDFARGAWEAATAAERERCAQIAERTYAKSATSFELGHAAAAAIRAGTP